MACDMKTGRPVGVDLGTTNSVVCYATEMGGRFETETVPVDGGRQSMPSVLYAGPDEALVGQAALNKLAANPEYVARSTKRHLGSGSSYRFPPATREYSPVGVASEILGVLAADASEYLAAEVEEAVITVPADFSDAQRRLTREAADMARLEVASLIAEPTAAALAYDLRDDDDSTILVFDLGGGTFDASLIDIEGGLYSVDATRGDNFLGGDDWTDAIVAFLEDHLERERGVIVPEDDTLTQGRLWFAAEQMKQRLSSASSAPSQSLQYLEVNGETFQSIDATITREEFHSRTAELRIAIMDHLDALFAGSHFTPEEVDDVLLVGGSTRMHQIPSLVTDYFGFEGQRSSNPDEVVATGAAIQGAILGNRTALEEGGSESMPVVRTGDSEVTLNETAVLDAATRSLGILFVTDYYDDARGEQVRDDRYHELIENNATIPTEETLSELRPETSDEGFPGASTVEVVVFQTAETSPTGDFAEKEEMGTLVLRGLDPTTPKEQQRMEVTFRVDEDNILQAWAVEKTTGAEVHGEFEPDFGFNPDALDEERTRLPRVYE